MNATVNLISFSLKSVPLLAGDLGLTEKALATALEIQDAVTTSIRPLEPMRETKHCDGAAQTDQSFSIGHHHDLAQLQTWRSEVGSQREQSGYRFLEDVTTIMAVLLDRLLNKNGQTAETAAIVEHFLRTDSVPVDYPCASRDRHHCVTFWDEDVEIPRFFQAVVNPMELLDTRNLLSLFFGIGYAPYASFAGSSLVHSGELVTSDLSPAQSGFGVVVALRLHQAALASPQDPAAWQHVAETLTLGNGFLPPEIVPGDTNLTLGKRWPLNPFYSTSDDPFPYREDSPSSTNN